MLCHAFFAHGNQLVAQSPHLAHLFDQMRLLEQGRIHEVVGVDVRIQREIRLIHHILQQRHHGIDERRVGRKGLIGIGLHRLRHQRLIQILDRLPGWDGVGQVWGKCLVHVRERLHAVAHPLLRLGQVRCLNCGRPASVLGRIQHPHQGPPIAHPQAFLGGKLDVLCCRGPQRCHQHHDGQHESERHPDRFGWKPHAPKRPDARCHQAMVTKERRNVVPLVVQTCRAHLKIL